MSTSQHTPPWAQVASALTKALRLSAPPVAIAFSPESPDHPAPAADPVFRPAPPNEHGRTGAVAAGCVFWIKGAESELITHAIDHANCSVGSLTHGFRTLTEVVDNDDVQAVLAAGWVDQQGVSQLPVVPAWTATVAYAPLATASFAPDVVLVRTNARGLMTIKNAVPKLAVEGKPQCHIIAMAKEQGVVAASLGCALSRARTGMRADEATCAFPAATLETLAGDLAHHAELDARMAQYAGADARRFAD